MPARSAHAAGPDVRLILRTLGGMSLHVQRQGEEPALALTAGKPLALLTYLALAPNQSAPRDRLVDLLWSDRDHDAALNSLRVALTNLRKLGSNVLGPTKDPVVLPALVESDQHALLAAWERRDFPAVVELFSGDFLPSFAAPGAGAFEEWADGERARLRAVFVRAAESVARDQLSTGHFREAESLARRARDLDQYKDAGWRLLLECLLTTNDTLALVTECATLERLLAEDALTLEPATTELLRKAHKALRAAARRDDTDEPPLVAELVGREREFSAMMRAWQTVRGGQVVLVHVEAPAGLGKTRLLDDVRRRLDATNAQVVRVAARHGARELAYAFASELADVLGREPAALGISPRWASVLVGLAPALSELFTTASPDD